MDKVTKTFNKIRLICLALVITMTLGGIGQLNTRTAAAAGWLSGWSNRVQLTINHTYVTSALSNFPVLIHLSSSSGTNAANVSAIFTSLGSNSRKIAVTGADGVSQYYIEIDTWNSSTKQAVLYAKVPNVSSSADTVLYLYYDNSHADNSGYVGPTGSAAAQNVWDSNFVAVYHMSQSLTGATGEVKDSTSKQHNGTGLKAGSGSYPTLVSGQDGSALQFDGTSKAPGGGYVRIPDSDDFSQPTTGYLMISFWMKPTANFYEQVSGEHYTRIFGKQASGGVEWAARLYSTASTDGLAFYVYNLSGALGSGCNLNAPSYEPSVGKWTYVTYMLTPYNSGSGLDRGWLGAPPDVPWTNGGSTSQSAGGGFIKRAVTYSSMSVTPGNGSSPVIIGGAYESASGFYTGAFDEIRFSNSGRSEAWITASFYSDRDGLIRYGTPESSGSGSTTTSPSVTTAAATSITTTGAALSGSLTSLGSAGSVSVSFQYGPTASYVSSTAANAQTVTGNFSTSVTGLTAGTTYHYRAVATGDGTAYGADQTFNTSSNTSSPSVSTLAATNIASTSATFNGNLSGLGSSSSASVGFQYGTTNSYGNSISSQTRTATGTFSASVSGLSAGTNYHYRAVVANSVIVYGTDRTFTTTSSNSTSGTFGLNSGDAAFAASFFNAQRFQNNVGTGTLTSLQVQVTSGSSGSLRLGVYADNNGLPGSLLLDVGSVTASAGWAGISGLKLPVSAGAYYWLAFLPSTGISVAYQSTGMPLNSHTDYRYTYGALPAACLTNGEINGTPFVMRATVTAP